MNSELNPSGLIIVHTSTSHAHMINFIYLILMSGLSLYISYKEGNLPGLKSKGPSVKYCLTLARTKDFRNIFIWRWAGVPLKE